jgi:hypothetical protein
MPRLHNDHIVMGLTFTGAALAVVAASDVAPAELRLAAGAIAAGCGATLALMRQAGHPPPTHPTAGAS